MSDNLNPLFFCFLEVVIRDIEDVLQMTAQNKLRAAEDKTAA